MVAGFVTIISPTVFFSIIVVQLYISYLAPSRGGTNSTISRRHINAAAQGTKYEGTMVVTGKHMINIRKGQMHGVKDENLKLKRKYLLRRMQDGRCTIQGEKTACIMWEGAVK